MTASLHWQSSHGDANPFGGDLRSNGSGLPALEDGLILAVRHAEASVYAQDTELRILWMVNLPAPWQRARPGMTEDGLLPKVEALRLQESKQRVLATGRGERFDLMLEGARWFNIRVEPSLDTSGTVAGLVTTLVDVTEHRQREQVLRTLLREVSHRSKNLLAIIQSIASQTARYSGTIEQFLDRFRGRLQSLASSQDLVTLSNWRGADLSELVTDQVRRTASEPRDRVRFSGVNLHLNPNAALHVGLALHELTANSVNYGALSQPHGEITIDASFLEENGQRQLCLLWCEPVSAAAVEAKREKRFGSLALEHVVPTSLRGHAHWTVGSGEVCYRLTMPLANILS